MRSIVAATLFLFGSALFAQTNFNFTPYPTDGSEADSAASADFDRDGYPDMAVLNGSGSSGTVDIFFNNHSGGFGAFTSYGISGSGTILAVDVNGDGYPDLLIAHGDGTPSTLLINNGNGTFHMGASVTTKLAVSSFVAGDFNNDGKVDLAASEGKQIEILLGKGNGSFTSGQILALSGSTSRASVGDFDNDGKLDIANSEGAKALVWWGKGDGTFAAPTQIQAPTKDGFNSLATADFNNDGLEDLAIGTSHYNGCTNPEDVCGTTTAHIYKNLGGRKFSLVSSFLIGNDLDGILYTADLNGDLNPDVIDLISRGGVASGDFSFRPGNGNNTFGAEQIIDQGSAFEVDFRDLNLDSRQDVIEPSYFPSAEVEVGLGTNAPKTCPGASSASLNAKVCAPANNAKVSSSFLVTAAGNSPLGVKRLEVWVDGKKVYQKLGDHLNKKITVATGKHRLVIVAVDKYLGTSSTVENITVQ